MTNQPVWKFVANLGDVNPLDYGGYFIFEDKTKVYPPEGEYYDVDDKKVYRVSLERKELWAGHLIPYGFSKDASLPYPISSYIEWFDSDIESVASFVGMSSDELRHMFTSGDTITLARAYENLASYFGWYELDLYPLELSPEEAKQRYSKYLK